MCDTRGLPAKFVRTARKRACRLACRLGRRPALDRPLFIVGCGRSGTTALGEALSVHPAVTYLNEHRQLWADAYPETDVWSDRAAARGGRIDLSAAVCTPERSRRLVANFYCETYATGRPRLVEKLPINSFRLAFVAAAVPDARFVHLLRNGLEVARSIERMPPESAWYGHDDYKWKLLCEYAARREGCASLPELCDSARLRGLLEWRLSVEAALEFLETFPPDRRLDVTYEELLDAPVDVMRRIEEFAGLPPAASVDSFAEANLTRRSPVIEVTSLSDAEERLAGDLMRRLGYLKS